MESTSTADESSADANAVVSASEETRDDGDEAGGDYDAKSSSCSALAEESSQHSAARVDPAASALESSSVDVSSGDGTPPQ